MVQMELALISHEIDKSVIKQRAMDGYVNATEMCTATRKLVGDYLRLSSTKEFTAELSRSMGIPIDLLIVTVISGSNDARGTWVHPDIAINLGQWCSPKFAVAVSKWVREWASGEMRTQTSLPYHIRRYLVNRSKIPPTHFSMLDEMTLRLVAPLEASGYLLPTDLMPDISMGKMFSKWCRKNGYNPDTFPTYWHEFDDGKRPAVKARLYPNEILTAFRLYFNNIWLKERALTYFGERDKSILPYLEEVVRELPE